MTDDDDANQGYSGNQGNRNSGGGGNSGGGNIIMMILPFLFRYPKIVIPLLLIGGAFYFFKGGCSGGSSKEQRASYGRGATLDQKVYDSAQVYAALSPDEQLPERVSLEKFAPSAQDQGQQGSCVGWGSTYAARTILEAVNTGQDPNKIAFSPAYTYNQIGLEDCQGTYINKAMDLLTNNGSVPYKEFPYDENHALNNLIATLKKMLNNLK